MQWAVAPECAVLASPGFSRGVAHISLPLSHAISVPILKEEGKVKEYGGVRFLQDCAGGVACCEDI